MDFKLEFGSIKVGLFLVFMVTLSVFFTVLFEDIKRIDEPSDDLVREVEEKYLTENLKNDFKAFGLFVTDECAGLIIENSQNIIVDEVYVNFNREIAIPVSKLSENSRNLLEGIYKNMKNKCISNKNKLRVGIMK